MPGSKRTPPTSVRISRLWNWKKRHAGLQKHEPFADAGREAVSVIRKEIFIGQVRVTDQDGGRRGTFQGDEMGIACEVDAVLASLKDSHGVALGARVNI